MGKIIFHNKGIRWNLFGICSLGQHWAVHAGTLGRRENENLRQRMQQRFPLNCRTNPYPFPRQSKWSQNMEILTQQVPKARRGGTPSLMSMNFCRAMAAHSQSVSARSGASLALPPSEALSKRGEGRPGDENDAASLQVEFDGLNSLHLCCWKQHFYAFLMITSLSNWFTQISRWWPYIP